MADGASLGLHATRRLIIERARLLDISVAALGETTPASPRVLPLDGVGTPRKATGLLVADLTSMWAGPLCGQLLIRAGATVIKVESPSRQDGTRAGNRAFFDWMNAGKLSYAIDFDREPTYCMACCWPRRPGPRRWGADRDRDDRSRRNICGITDDRRRVSRPLTATKAPRSCPRPRSGQPDRGGLLAARSGTSS